jgi:hypothetical protein
MRRFVPLLIAGIAMIAAACRESIAPTRSGSVPRLESFGAPVAFFQSVNANVPTKSVTFTIDPAGGRVKIGDFSLDYPANAVCDPATSGYGPDTWELPCETLGEAITITATYWWEGKTAYVDFSPDIRFAPDKEVFLGTKRGAKNADELQRFTMYYFKTIGDTRYFIDEAAVDQTVQTQREFSSKRVWRRVKHFSGISIDSGMLCDETVGDPDCIPLETEIQLQW